MTLVGWLQIGLLFLLTLALIKPLGLFMASVFQGERYLSGAETDLELLAIAKRAAEMKWESLRLIRRGPTE